MNMITIRSPRTFLLFAAVVLLLLSTAMTGVSAQKKKSRHYIDRQLSRDSAIMNPVKPRPYVLVEGVKVDKPLYFKVLRLAKRRANGEYNAYLRMMSRAKIVPGWKERVRVRLATIGTAKALVGHFFATYRRILQPHHSDLDYSSSQRIMKKTVERMGSEQFKLFSNWFKKRYHKSLHEDDVYEEGPKEDPLNVEPGHSGTEPVQPLSKEDRGIAEFSNDPNFLDRRHQGFDTHGLLKIREKGGFPKDWAGRLLDPRNPKAYTAPAEQGDPNDSALNSIP